MKFFFTALLIMMLNSCTKGMLAAPKSLNQNIAVNNTVSYQDNSISIVDFKAGLDNNAINVTFTTLYEKNIVKLEILRGLTINNLCSIYKQDVSTDSYSATKYSILDKENYNIDAIYYIVKYTLANGDWGYTPVFQLSL